MNNIDQSMRLKKAHVALMKHQETALYSGIMLMGKSVVVDEEITAYTDGYNKSTKKLFLFYKEIGIGLILTLTADL